MIQFSIRSSIVIVMLTLLSFCGGQSKTTNTADKEKQDEPIKDETEKEPHTSVVAFISTQCPHSAEALRILMQIHKEMGDAVSLHVGYVGAVDAEGKIDRTIGEAEIGSAVAQVCAGMSANEASWLTYLNCLYEGEIWRSQPLGWQTCAEKSGIDRTDVEACIKSGEGETMLAKAYSAAMESRISASPTIIVGQHLYGGPRTADALMQYLCYTAGVPETRPTVCSSVTPPKKISATMLYDVRCKSALQCDVEGEIAVLEKLIPGFELTRVEFSSDNGQSLYNRILKADPNAGKLPAIIIDHAINDQEALKSLLGEYLLPFEDGYMFALGGGWDPLAEDCTNGIDDNGNGKIDCEDDFCKKKWECREEIKKRVDLFIMSRCPYALDLLPDVNRFLDHFNRDRKLVDLRIQFIGNVTVLKTLVSMHGEEEIEENLRMICAQELYPEKYKFMEYVLCRASSFESTNWEACVAKGMNKAKLQSCSEGKRGQELLEASFTTAKELGIGGSPTWLLNNRESMKARSYPDITVSYCNHNELEECKNPPVAVEKAIESPKTCR